jgi:uncharacterized membrane protein
MRNNHITRLVTLALMVALTILLGVTPLGYLPPIFGVEITIMCLPVIIATIALGLRGGLVIGLAFAATSLYQALTAPAGLLAPLVAYPAAMYPSIFIPRLLIPVVTYLIYKATRKLPNGWRFGISAAAGSLSNTIFFLLFVYVLGANQLAAFFGMTKQAVLAALAVLIPTNGLMEMAAAVIICVPVLFALKAAMPHLFRETKQDFATKEK